MSDKLFEMLTKLPRRNLVNLMWSALDYMQHYNGYDKTTAIALAMGCDIDGNHKVVKVPSFREVKESTEYMGF